LHHQPLLLVGRDLLDIRVLVSAGQPRPGVGLVGGQRGVPAGPIWGDGLPGAGGRGEPAGEEVAAGQGGQAGQAGQHSQRGEQVAGAWHRCRMHNPRTPFLSDKPLPGPPFQ
jgi:hypothetical protein